MDDPRTDELLDQAGRMAWKLGLRLPWSDGLAGAAAKQCSRAGSASWKKPPPLNANEDAAVGAFKTRARKRNPCVPAVANGLVLVEVDLDVPDDEYPDLPEVEARVGRLLRRLELRFPRSVVVRSRRGLHFYLRPPSGRDPAKVQITEAEDAVTWSTDGYVVGVPGLHELAGVIYQYVHDGPIVEMPVATYERLFELGGDAHSERRRRFEEGEEIRQGDRREAIFGMALERIRVGAGRAAIIEELQAANRERCRPPLKPDQVLEQIDGAIKYARKHPTETEKARSKAQRILCEQRTEPTAKPKPAGAKPALWLPFVDVQLTGPPRWLWRGKVPEGAVTLLAGRPKLGKSLLTVWLAAQLSRGLLDGAYGETPARTLLIAAEDPPDPIVKGRLIAAAADQALVGTLASRPSRPSRQSQENLDGLDGLDRAGAYARRITIPDEYELLEQIVVENAIALVVLDPINSFLSHRIDAHRDAEIRRVLDPLAALSARRRFASLAVVHLNRRSDRDVLNRITGSGGYGGSARSILTFGRHPENDAQRVVASEGNWQKESQSELFELREVIVFPDAAPEEQTQPALVHVGVTDLDSSDLVDEGDEDRSALDQAKEYLLGELAGGPVAVADIRRGAEANGLSWPTVERAKKLLGVQARRISAASAPRGSGRWEWFLEFVEEEGEE